MRVEKVLFKIFLFDRSSLKFTLGVMLGLAFSIAVILSTIGLMDGFVYGLKSSLKQSQGDIVIQSREGFFSESSILEDELDILDIPKDQRAQLIQTEGFLLFGTQARGVVLRGVEPESFYRVTGLDLKSLDPTHSDQIVLGQKLANDFGISVGDQVTMTFAQGSRTGRGMPLMRRLTVSGLVEHKIHEQGERFTYMNLSALQNILGVSDRFNYYTFNLNHQGRTLEDSPVRYSQRVEENFSRVRQRLNWNYSVRPFWHEFSSLIEAVEVEKGMIALILQIIVVISVFNVVALIIYFNEKRARQIFLFQALGMSRKRLTRSWLLFALCIWFAASIFSLIFVEIFNFCLQNLAFFHLPGDVYHLGSLSLRIELFDYFLVFGVTLLWILAVAWFTFFRMRKKSLLSGLREEFS